MTPSPSDILAQLQTEQRNPASADLDLLSTESILRLMNAEDKTVAVAVEREIPFIARAVELLVDTLRKGGRLFYCGAGTSGRLGILDASECPPTFGTDPARIRGMIAGGREAVFRSQEGAEDNEAQAVKDVDAEGVNAGDLFCGIAASRRTPYVTAAVARARALGAKTMFITTNPREEFDLSVDVAICPAVGPEILMGSTRLKSGTAQKLVLNMLTTTTMVRLGKVYQNMMVDLQLTNSKLADRAKRIVKMATAADDATASRALDQAGGHVKTAIVMIAAGLDAGEARRRIDEAGGFIRPAMQRKGDR